MLTAALDPSRALLVRVGADMTDVGGRWHGPVDAQTGRFAYVPIREPKPTGDGLATWYRDLAPMLAPFGSTLPSRLATERTHLDPDFEHLTYGDQGQRAAQIRSKLSPGDALVFFAALRDIRESYPLVYALIGLLEVGSIAPASAVAEEHRYRNAHTRRDPIGETDIVVTGRSGPGRSGRFDRCLPFATYRSGAYRVRPELLEAWGGLAVRDGYVQRSARLPELAEPRRFTRWLRTQGIAVVASNRGG